MTENNLTLIPKRQFDWRVGYVRLSKGALFYVSFVSSTVTRTSRTSHSLQLDTLQSIAFVGHAHRTIPVPSQFFFTKQSCSTNCPLLRLVACERMKAPWENTAKHPVKKQGHIRFAWDDCMSQTGNLVILSFYMDSEKRMLCMVMRCWHMNSAAIPWSQQKTFPGIRMYLYSTSYSCWNPVSVLEKDIFQM